MSDTRTRPVRPTRTTATPARRAAHPRALLAVILVAYLMILIDNSIVFTGVPSIRADLDLSVTGASWVQDAYGLTFGGLLLLGARLGDVLGRRQVFIAALAVFSVASMAVGAAPSGAWLISARAVQGVGSAVLAPSTLGLLTAGFAEGRERTRAVAAYGTMAGIGAALGLVLGGLITDLSSWRVGFFVNVPIGLALALATLRVVPPTAGRPGRFDLAGAVTSTVGMSALVYGIVRGGEHGWADPVSLTALVGALLLLAVFVRVESRAAEPVMPLRLFASRERTGAYAARFLFIGAMISYFLFVSQFLQGVRGWSPLQAGAAFLPMTVVNFAVALPISRLTARYGAARLLTAGVATTLLGMAWLSRLGADSSYALHIALPMVLIGAGQGLAFAPLTGAGIARVGQGDAGAASGLVNAAHQVGGALGLGVLVSVAAAATSGATPAEQLTSATTAALTGSAVLLTAALAVVALLLVPAARASRDR